MDVKYHVRCNISSKSGVFVGVQVVEKLVDVFFCVFSCLGLFCSNAAEADKCGQVNSSSIVHDGSNNLLNAEYMFRW